ncbi:hypothetical protein B566_EDAN008368 [Ephemera danica]|nr:hypothetical protein B566_EDAN008368 [Ephemera danica]
MEWPAAETHGSDEEDEDEQFVEMPLEKGFAETLLHMFGGPPLTKMKDENLAFELTQQNDRSHPKEVPDLKEIMDMEMTLACFRNEQKFPKIDSQALDSVFAAHGHNYKKTLDAIIASFGGNSSVCTVMSPEAIARCEKQLLEKARDETLKLASEKKKTQLVVEVPLSQLSSNDERKQALEEAQRYRDEANEHRKHRVQCFNKAENALRQGMPQGQLHKQRMEQANGSAAACLFGVANADTLDLHYLYVAEALEVLDVFLDYHAERVSKGCQKRKTVELVTGRGLRSEGGKPRIKPAVIRRLKQRGLR